MIFQTEFFLRRNLDWAWLILVIQRLSYMFVRFNMISVEKVPVVHRVGLSQISNLIIRLRAFFFLHRMTKKKKIPISHSFLLSIKALTTKELQPLKHLTFNFHQYLIDKPSIVINSGQQPNSPPYCIKLVVFLWTPNINLHTLICKVSQLICHMLK